ncbi:MAG: class I SAM-dependent methyltransferase [Planctomycetaceae bacterium]|nr:class I SAM-dependent methyltransferase [Planctomycetaceae bacterium]
MGFYSRTIFPWLCDLALDKPFVAKHRRELLSEVSGEILEIGFGTGLNLSCYPEEVHKITVVDPNAGMHRRAQRRLRQSDIEVDKRILSSEELPFEEATFDCVVSTFTLCSIRQVERALEEVFRVLKPEGRFLVLEHGLSNNSEVQKWQRWLNGPQQLFGDHCQLVRNIRELVAKQPFRSVELDEFYLEKTPKTHGYIYRGVAIK